MKILKNTLITVFLSTVLNLSGQTQVLLSRGLYSVDKSIELELNKFAWADTGTLFGYMIGQLGYGFTLAIFKDSCIIASFGLSDGKIYKYNESDKDSTDFIPLPSVSQKVILSRKPVFQKEDIVSGLVEIKSVPFYYVGINGKFRIELQAYFKTGALKEIQ